MQYRFAEGLGLDPLNERLMGEAAVRHLQSSQRTTFLCGGSGTGEPLIAIQEPDGGVLIRIARLDETVREVGYEIEDRAPGLKVVGGREG